MNFKNPFRKSQLMNDNGKMKDVIIEDNLKNQGTIDPNEICFEAYNPCKYSIFFYEMPGKGNQVLELKPDQHLLIPHHYFTVKTKGGEPCTFIRHYGDQKFQGKKTSDEIFK